VGCLMASHRNVLRQPAVNVPCARPGQRRGPKRTDPGREGARRQFWRARERARPICHGVEESTPRIDCPAPPPMAPAASSSFPSSRSRTLIPHPALLSLLTFQDFLTPPPASTLVPVYIYATPPTHSPPSLWRSPLPPVLGLSGTPSSCF
jgi:hypothetical protein